MRRREKMRTGKTATKRAQQHQQQRKQNTIVNIADSKVAKQTPASYTLSCVRVCVFALLYNDFGIVNDLLCARMDAALYSL